MGDLMRFIMILLTACLGLLAVSGERPALAAGPSQPDASGGEAASFSEGMVSITFDDAWKSQYTNALPALEAAGIKGTFYMTTEPVQSGWPDFVTPDQIKDIAARGHEIGGHSITHPNLSRLSKQRVIKELTESKLYLEKLTGQTVTSFAYPFGDSDQRIEKLTAEAGYSSGRGVQIGDLVTPAASKMDLNALLPLNRTSLETVTAAIDQAKTKKRWLILAFHKVEERGGQFSVTPAMFRNCAEAVKASGVKTVTVAEGIALMRQTAAQNVQGR
jgi:peptidoglycan/xylan/chitin deacetylase (PgdA/CDA1 family)